MTQKSKKSKLNDIQFRALIYQIDMLDEQISFLRSQKYLLIESSGLTEQGYYDRKKKMDSTLGRYIKYEDLVNSLITMNTKGE